MFSNGEKLIMSDRIRKMANFYESNPVLVSSPFVKGGYLDYGLIDRTFERLRIKLDGSFVVDVGCGFGYISDYIRQSKARYFGLDILIHRTASRFIGDKVHFSMADSLWLPIKSNSVDLVLCTDSFEHYHDQYLAAQEFRRVLKDGGQVFLSVPNYLNIAGLVKKYAERFGGYKPKSWAPFDFWKPQVLEEFMIPSRVRRIFRSVGFRHFKMIGYDEEMLYAVLPWIWHNKFPKRLARGMYVVQKPFQGLFARLCPKFSLHSFWRIST